MKEQKPNRKPDQIFVRKGLATPSPGTEQELEHLSLYQEAVREPGRQSPADPVSSVEEGTAEDEVAPAGSLLAVDMRNHSGRAWIEAQNGDLASSDFSSLLLRQGNLPLDTPVSADESTAKTWKRLREEFGDEAKESEDAVRALPSWSSIKESKGKEDAPEKAPALEVKGGEQKQGQDDDAGGPALFAEPRPGKRIDLVANAEALSMGEPASPAEPGLFAEVHNAPEPTIPEPTIPEPTTPEPTTPEPVTPGPTAPEPTVSIEPPAAPPSPPPSHAEPSRDRPGVAGVALAMIALAAVGAGLWFQFGTARDEAESPSVAAVDKPQGTTPAETAAAAPRPEPAPAETLAPQTAAAGTSGATAEPVVALSDPATTEAPATMEAPPPQVTDVVSSPAVAPSDASQPARIEPSFDLVRIEPDGQAVIAGRAEPFTDLIILDNGEPIGTARSNAEGEWAFIPDEPLPPGEHQIAMVVNTPQGEVILRDPRLSADTAEGAAPTVQEAPNAAGDLAALDQAGGAQEVLSEPGSPPVPRSKPETVIARTLPPYGVQLSSNTSRQSAEVVWRELQLKYPDLLGDKTLMIQEVQLDQSGTRFRVQTGLFDDLASARKLCQAFAERQQECLVFKR